MCISLPMVCWYAIFEVCLSGLSDILECLGDLQMKVVWLDKHPSSQKLPHDWPRKLGHKLVTNCDIWSLNGPQVRPSDSVNFYMWKNLPLHVSPPPPISILTYVIICDSYWCKSYPKWWAIQLAVLCRIGQLKDIV